MRVVALSIIVFIGVLVLVDIAFNQGAITTQVIELVRHEVRALRR